eukprot:302488_1
MNSIYHYIFLTLIFVTHLWINQARELNLVACDDQCFQVEDRCMQDKLDCSRNPQNCNRDCSNEYNECLTECNESNCDKCNDYPYSGYCIDDKPCKDQCPSSNINCDNAECDECAT